MHTFEGEEHTYLHNGDFSGVVDIRAKGNIVSVPCVSVPFEELKNLVAKYIRIKKTLELENMSTDDLLMGKTSR